MMRAVLTALAMALLALGVGGCETYTSANGTLALPGRQIEIAISASRIREEDSLWRGPGELVTIDTAGVRLTCVPDGTVILHADHTELSMESAPDRVRTTVVLPLAIVTVINAAGSALDRLPEALERGMASPDASLRDASRWSATLLLAGDRIRFHGTTRGQGQVWGWFKLNDIARTHLQQVLRAEANEYHTEHG